MKGFIFFVLIVLAVLYVFAKYDLFYPLLVFFKGISEPVVVR